MGGRRAARESAVGKLRGLGLQFGLDGISKRASPDEVSAYYKLLCKKVSPDSVDELLAARTEWVDNGGGGDMPGIGKGSASRFT